MENLIFSLNSTIPVFIIMLFGVLLKHIGIFDEGFASKMNKFVFLIPLPCLLFSQLSQVDFQKAWNTKFVLFCFVSTAVCILIAFLLSLFIKNKSLRGEFIQASYRSSAALLGIAFIQNIYGNAGFAPLMIIGSVPLYNIMAVVVLSVFSPENHSKKPDALLVKKTVMGIVKNPIIIGIVLGLFWSALKIPVPYILDKAVSNLGAVATPMGLMAMGASLDFKRAFGHILPTICATALKLMGFALIILPFAVAFGFRDAELVAILIMLTSATTVSSFVMAKNMGHDGTLTGSTVMLTTLLSAFTVTLWLFVLKSGGLI
ncbi:MAG: AEC family transporter [Clostridia bacterium]|nr:AEC family transporter [Clostridia bacterium]